jgi:hypothetical protein
MNKSLSLASRTAPSELARDGQKQGSSQPTASGPTDFAVRRPPEFLQLVHSSDTGLSAADAEAIFQTVGPKRIDSAKPKRLRADIFGRFRNPLVVILLGVKRWFFARYQLG